jgi:F-type H+-transporting ATPase subunit c
MNKTGFFCRAAAIALFAVVLAFVVGAPAVYAQGEPAAEAAATPAWHYIGAYFGLGLIVIGAGLGIGKGAAAAADGISRQPAAAAQITGTVNLPIFLLEGVAILAEVFVLIVVVLK